MTNPKLPSDLTSVRVRYLVVKHLNRYRSLIKYGENGGKFVNVPECERLLHVWMMIDMAGGSLDPARYSLTELQELLDAYRDEEWEVPDDQLITTEQLLRNYRDSFAVTARSVRRAARHHAKQFGKEITCQPNCAHCCYQKVLVGVADGLVIYEELKSTGRWTPELQAKLKEADRQMTENDHAMYFERNIPCAFLDEESSGRGKCTVYESRPVACAATFSMGGDPNYCRRADNSHDTKGQFQIFSNELAVSIFFNAHSHLQYNLEKADQLTLMTLPGAVLWAAAQQEQQPKPEVRRVKYILTDMGASIDNFDSVAIHRKETP